MVPDQIERETVIDAPVERVWALITEAEHLGRWFGDAGAEIDLRPGGAMVLRWAEHGTSRGRVVAVEPHTRFSYRWAPFKDPGGDEPVEGNSTLVEFTLQPEGDGTRLRVVESGFASLATSEEQRAKNAQGQHRGLGARDRRAARVRGEGRRLMSAPAEGVFAALADPTRWRVLSLLAERGEGTATSLAGELPVSRVAVVKHLAVLDRAGLVEGRRAGPRGPLHRPHRAARRNRPLDGRARVAVGRPPGGDQADRRGTTRTESRRSRHEHTPDRVAAGVGGRAPANCSSRRSS